MNENLSVEYGWCIAALVIAGLVVTLAASVIRAHKGDSDEPTSNPSRPDSRGKPRRNQHRGRGNDRARGIDNLPYPLAEPDAGVPVVDGAAVLRDAVRPAGGPDDPKPQSDAIAELGAQLDAIAPAFGYGNAHRGAFNRFSLIRALGIPDALANKYGDHVRDGRQDGEGGDRDQPDERRG